MSQVYKRVRGMKIEKLIARHQVVQARLDKEIGRAQLRAEAKLAQHRSNRDTNHARIETSKGRIDRWLTLDDPAGMSIEFGRAPDEDGRGGMEGLRILRDAFGEGVLP